MTTTEELTFETPLPVLEELAAKVRATYGSGTYGGDAHVFPPRGDLPIGESKTGWNEYETHVAHQDVIAVLDRATTSR